MRARGAAEVGEERLERPHAGRVVGRDLPGQRDRPGLGLGGRREAVHDAEGERLLRLDDAAGEDEVLGHGEADERHEPRGADRRAHPRSRPHELQRVARDAQVAPGHELGARADDVADADRDRRRREGLDRGVDAREGLHARDRAGVVERLAEVGARAERARVGRGEHERAEVVVGRERRQRLLEREQRRGVEGVAGLGAVEPEELDPGVEALASQAGHGPIVL